MVTKFSIISWIWDWQADPINFACSWLDSMRFQYLANGSRANRNRFLRVASPKNVAPVLPVQFCRLVIMNQLPKGRCQQGRPVCIRACFSWLRIHNSANAWLIMATLHVFVALEPVLYWHDQTANHALMLNIQVFIDHFLNLNQQRALLEGASRLLLPEVQSYLVTRHHLGHWSNKNLLCFIFQKRRLLITPRFSIAPWL